MNIGKYTFNEYLDLARDFHGYPAPGIIIGGIMVSQALSRLPEGKLYDAVCETGKCLPDAIQLLTPCTIGNGWLKIVNLGRFAMCLYEKYTGDGVRVFLDPARLEPWPEIKAWYLKLKPKKEQDSGRLLNQIIEAGASILGFHEARVNSEFLSAGHGEAIVICPSCGEAYPSSHGTVCRACRGDSPYMRAESSASERADVLYPGLEKLPLEKAVGRKAAHDMTQIIPGESKGPAVKRGQVISAGDLCRLQQMGRGEVYVESAVEAESEWVHEDEAALTLARGMSGPGVTFKMPPSEGKINLLAERDGLFLASEDNLERFNLSGGVMCASRHNYSVVKKGQVLAGTRAIPLFLHRDDLNNALKALETGPLFQVRPLRLARAGVLISGTEVFQGLIQDRFLPIIQSKVAKLGGKVISHIIAPDNRGEISLAIKNLLDSGVDLLITTAGLSVDPDDLTRQGLIDAGATDIIYGTAILPGAMTLLARIGDVQVIGVPACALYFKTTSLDLLLPRLLADLDITRVDLARLGHGALCLDCPECLFPRCPFGK